RPLPQRVSAGEMEESVRRAVHSAARSAGSRKAPRHASNDPHLSGVPSAVAAQTFCSSKGNRTMKCNLPKGPSLVDAHFTGRISPARERDLRSPLAACDTCRDYYERHLFVSALDPRSRSAKDRLALGLGLAPRAKPSKMAPVAVAFAAAAV